jgi:hypothetical protein
MTSCYCCIVLHISVVCGCASTCRYSGFFQDSSDPQQRPVGCQPAVMCCAGLVMLPISGIGTNVQVLLVADNWLPYIVWHSYACMQWFFSWTFAVSTVTIVSGCLAERTSLITYPIITVSALVMVIVTGPRWCAHLPEARQCSTMPIPGTAAFLPDILATPHLLYPGAAQCMGPPCGSALGMELSWVDPHCQPVQVPGLCGRLCGTLNR